MLKEYNKIEIEMLKVDNKILKFNHGEKSMKVLLLFMLT